MTHTPRVAWSTRPELSRDGRDVRQDTEMTGMLGLDDMRDLLHQARCGKPFSWMGMVQPDSGHPELAVWICGLGILIPILVEGRWETTPEHHQIIRTAN